jgi:cyanophycin synthetase
MAAHTLLIEPSTIDPSALAVRRIRPVRGPNVWSLEPVIACDVTGGALDQLTSADLPGFVERLLDAMPSLASHPCSRRSSGGLVERLREGTGWPHILEHVALELQSLAGDEVRFGRVVASGDAAVWAVVVAYQDEAVGVTAVKQGTEVIRACVGGSRIDVGGIVAELRRIRDLGRLGPSTGAIVEEARRRGIPIRRLDTGSLIQLGLGRHLRRIRATTTDRTSIIGVDIAQDKDLTKRVLGNIGLAVPEGRIVGSSEEAVAAARELGFPVILKPRAGNQGRGISPRLDDGADVRAAWQRSAAFHPNMVIERFVAGRDHRVLVVNNTVIAVAERVAAHVVGDGRSTVRDLIEIANRDPRRGDGHASVLTRLLVDDHTLEFLAASGRSLDTVPAEAERIFLRAAANLSTGGTSIDRTDEIHPDNAVACEMAAGMIGLDIAGLDVLTPDISVPFHENGAVIVEVNAAPGIRMHQAPVEGKPRNVASAVVDMLFPPGARTTIPIVAVTGTNGKTTTTRLIAHLFRQAGKVVGFTTTDGVYLQNRLVVAGDMTGPFAANVILANPTVDVAVLETARGGIIRAGLGFEECDVGVVLNIASDHLGLHGVQTLEQLAEVKSVIPAVVKRRGFAVLNADDPLVYRMGERTRGDIVLFSVGAERPNPLVEAHVEGGGTAVVIRNGTFVIQRGRLSIPVAQTREVPLTLEGAARFQCGNVLAAIGAAYVQGMQYEEIRAGLVTFVPSPALTPGRMNLVRVGHGRVLVDYAHNTAAVQALLDTVMRLDARRRIGVIAAPGDRRDDDVRAIGRLFARLDHIVLKEDADRRGRARGEVPRLLKEGLRSAGMPAHAIEFVPAEPDALARGLSIMRERDLVVITAVDVAAVLGQLRS